jgi:hypothetical protein
MVGAPQLIKKIFQPLKTKLPKVYALLFIVVGMTTIVERLSKLSTDVNLEKTSQAGIHKCH